jgi:ketosteroid isomerase-like protein
MFPRNRFLSVLSCALVALCFVASACSSKQKGFITKQQVAAFLDEMDEAARNKDVDALVANLSEDVQFKVTVEGFGPTQTLTFNRDQYRDYSRQALSVVSDYDYRRGETVIKVEPDGQTAFVADETFETTTMGGQVLRTVARGTSILKLENGKLVISRSEAVARPLKPGENIQPTKF